MYTLVNAGRFYPLTSDGILGVSPQVLAWGMNFPLILFNYPATHPATFYHFLIVFFIYLLQQLQLILSTDFVVEQLTLRL